MNVRTLPGRALALSGIPHFRALQNPGPAQTRAPAASLFRWLVGEPGVQRERLLEVGAGLFDLSSRFMLL